MEKNLIIIGIDSLDPYILKRLGTKLPFFSTIIDSNDVITSESVFPVDTIPAWMTIFTGLNPDRHGVFYVYDIFDYGFSDLSKISIEEIREKTFWHAAGTRGYKPLVIFPLLFYPPSMQNGIMVSKSPIEERIDQMKSRRSLLTYPREIQGKNDLPNSCETLYGGFPGVNQLQEWTDLGKNLLYKEEEVAIRLAKNEDWDLLFVYFDTLDIIQHRLWRFFDKDDPIYPGETTLEKIIPEFYLQFDSICKRFSNLFPDATLMIISDHGHKSRPIKTVNINEYLRREQLLQIRKKNLETRIKKSIGNILLEVTSKLDIEHLLIRIVGTSGQLTGISKSLYSSSGIIDKENSRAFLSTFAGIKSYSHGGIEINRRLISENEIQKLKSDIIKILLNMRNEEGTRMMKWARSREEMFTGEYTTRIYPDIIFEMLDDYGTGWELNSELSGRSYDHKVASGGHAKEGTFLIANQKKKISTRRIRLADIYPSVMDILEIQPSKDDLDGVSIFR